jgi:hypothetical protein
MQNQSRITAMVTILLTVAGTATAGPSITNGSFEAVQIGAPFFSTNPADIPGWTHTGTVGDALLWAIGYSDGGGTVAHTGDGNQFVTLGGGFLTSGSANWTSLITGLTPGSTYNLSFKVAFEGGDTPLPEQTMTIGFDSGSSTGPRDISAPSNSCNYWCIWLPESLDFTATAGSAVVDFSVTNQINDMGLDAVKVSAATVPEPASLAILGGRYWDSGSPAGVESDVWRALRLSP